MKTHWQRLIGILIVLGIGVAAFAPGGAMEPAAFSPESVSRAATGPGAGPRSAAEALYGLNTANQPMGDKPATEGPIVILPDHRDVSPPLRDIAPIAPQRQEETLIRWNEMELLPGSDKPGTDAVDPNLQTWQGPIDMPSPLQNWEGINNVNGVLPPDTQGDVGPNHYIQWVNLAYAIYNKTGTLLSGPTNGNTLWSGFGGDCETANDGDPITLYDHLGDRWFMSQFVLNTGGTSYQCIAVSQTADPTGAWYRYSYAWPNNYLNDYPHFGLWPDAYYLTVNQFNQTGTAFTGAGVAAYERSKMLTGASAQMVYWNLGTTYGGQLPADWEGSSAPPSGAPGLILEWDDGATTDSLRIWQAAVNWITPASSTLTLSYNLTTTNLDSDLCAATRERCVPQPGGAPNLEAISDRLMHRVQYRNFGTHQALVGNHTVDAGSGSAGIHWFELRNTGSAWSIYQQGTYAPADGLHRWMGSLAMDGDGNMALGYSVSSTGVYPGIRYVGRLATDALGTLPQAETVMQAGSGSQTYSNAGRWGDYSAMQIDPSDDCTFWYTQEYYQTTSAANWQTRIGAFKFPSCDASDFTIAAAPASQDICLGSNATVGVSVGKVGGFNSPVTLSAAFGPAGPSASFSPNPVTPPGSSALTISGAGPGSTNVTVTGTAGSLNHQASVTLNVSTPLAAAPTLTAPANSSTGVAATPTFTWNAVAGAVSYEIQVASDPAFNTIVASASGLAGTNWTPGSALASATAYYWRVRALNGCGAGPYSALAAFVTAAGGSSTLCRNVSLAIPDNNTTGVTDSQTVALSGALTDLNVSVRATHTWVGDLIFTVRNVATNTGVTVVDRPGVPANTVGCSNNHINATLDDQASLPVETQCATSTATTPPPYAIDGTFTPNNLLSAFNGQNLAGAWELNASDRAGQDTGTLTQWCLIATYGSALTADFSDLASTYGAAWHTGSGALRLGPTWTADASFAAGADVDDGVTFPGNFMAGQNVTVRVNVQGSPANGRWLRLWFDWNYNGVFDNDELVHNGSGLNGDNDLTVAVPVSASGPVPYRARLYDSATAPTAQEAIDSASHGGAASGEVEDDFSPTPLAVTLAEFSAQQVADYVQVNWETVSELDNRGFNLYRGTDPAGPDRQLNSELIPSQGQGSPSGFVYTWDDHADLTPNTIYFYWLEDVSISGSSTMHGPVSVLYMAPTAVTVAGMQATPVAPAALPLAGALLAMMAGLAGAAAGRRSRS